MDYHEQHATWANMHQPVAGKRVLVVGCNTGFDCTHFVERGAKEVHGLDIDANVGRDFEHPSVTYHRMSAEKMDLPSDRFDLVYSVATLEHVPDVEKAFFEMARVTAPRGLIYCLASPLWNSRHGHHFPQLFADFPWAHLRLTKEQAKDYLDLRWPDGTELGSTQVVVDYMYDPINFNHVHASIYVAACRSLRGFTIIKNEIDRELPESVPSDLAEELAKKGYNIEELTGVTHSLIARKRTIGSFWSRLRRKSS